MADEYRITKQGIRDAVTDIANDLGFKDDSPDALGIATEHILAHCKVQPSSLGITKQEIAAFCAEVCKDGKIYIHGGLAKIGWPHSKKGWVDAEELKRIFLSHCKVQTELIEPLFGWGTLFSPFYNTSDSSGQCRMCKHYAPSSRTI